MKDYMLKAWCALQTDRKGITALEYALIAGLVATGIVTAFTTFYTDLGTAMTTIGTGIAGN